MNIVVTGAAGFIGSHLCERLLNDNGNSQVIGIDNFSNGERRNMEKFANNPNFHFFEHDLSVGLDKKMSSIALSLGAKIDFVFHLAARGSVPRSIKDPHLTFVHNVKVTHDLLSWCEKHKVQRFFFASSSSVYGNLTRQWKNEHDPTAPINPYGMSKLIGEQYCKMFNQTYGLRTTAFRFFNVYGPRQKFRDEYSAVLPCWIDKTLKGEPIVLNNNGFQVRDFTYVKDVVTVLHNAIYCASRPVYNVACGDAITLSRFAEAYFQAIGVHPNIVLEPATREGDILSSQAEITMLKQDFNYVPIRTEQSLVDTYAYYKGISADPATKKRQAEIQAARDEIVFI